MEPIAVRIDGKITEVRFDAENGILVNGTDLVIRGVDRCLTT